MGGGGGVGGLSGRIQDAGLNVSPGKVFSASGMRQVGLLSYFFEVVEEVGYIVYI